MLGKEMRKRQSWVCERAYVKQTWKWRKETRKKRSQEQGIWRRFYFLSIGIEDMYQGIYNKSQILLNQLSYTLLTFEEGFESSKR